jgi:hypothetical protein
MMAELNRVNWFGFAGGITTILVVFVSLWYPWWQLTIGELFEANVSPVNANFGFLGSAFTVPFLWAINLVSLLILVASGTAMLVYSIIPDRSYSKHLLSFAYKKPLFSLLFFVVGLFAVTLIFQAVLSINVPFVGSATATLPQSLIQGVTISLLFSAEFLWPFWLAVAAAGFCLAARLYHKRIS